MRRLLTGSVLSLEACPILLPPTFPGLTPAILSSSAHTHSPPIQGPAPEADLPFQTLKSIKKKSNVVLAPVEDE